MKKILFFYNELKATFWFIHQFSAGSTAVIIRLMETLITINGFAKKDSYKKTVIKHAKMVLNVGKESIKEESDLRDLLERSRKIVLE